MKKINYTLLAVSLLTVTVLFTKCDVKEKTDTPSSRDNAPKIIQDLRIKTPPAEEPKLNPNETLFDIVKVIEDAEFKDDTSRLKQVPFYQRTTKGSRVINLQNVSFFRLDTANNPIFTCNSHLRYTSKHLVKEFDTIRFNSRKVIKILGYFFTEQPQLGLATDGMIEQWQFETDSNAQAVLHSLTGKKHPYYFVYFNSFACLFTKGNNLYTFYSRATWDSKLLEEIYSQILVQIDADCWTNNKGQVITKTITNKV